ASTSPASPARPNPTATPSSRAGTSGSRLDPRALATSAPSGGPTAAGGPGRMPPALAIADQAGSVTRYAGRSRRGRDSPRAQAKEAPVGEGAGAITTEGC